MGKQIYFYMLPPDEQALYEHLLSQSGVVYPYFQANPLIETVGLPGIEEKFGAFVRIWNPEISSQPEFQFVEKQGYYVTDTLRSEVVEWSRSYENDGRIVRGRLFYDDVFYSDDGIRRRKDAQFLQWAQSLFSWIKKTSAPTQSGDRIFPHAKLGIEADAEGLTQLPLAPNYRKFSR